MNQIHNIDPRIFDAILKGIVEHDQSDYYFGSLAGLRLYLELCAEAGLITPDGDATEKGRARYVNEKLADRPDCRWYFWSTTT